MRLLLASVATLAALSVALPAQAQSAASSASQFSGVASQPQFGINIHRGRGDGGRHHRRGDAIVVGGWGWSDGEWALYNNRSFDPESYNDWWHERPNRSYPRWMANNGDCQRMWWSGGGWRC
jgi:hypothetical protein